ncbi:11718_t:CDS:2 [Acaulospora colombiana]|uniref:11718_t:CDS:1 n=1 Tax=Acaulospora colombiana TaxID=27376 RepID=A0ACA9L5L2_9GLOM|nr:11718_t:CDS:2 [Acaulospora colombiana]
MNPDWFDAAMIEKEISFCKQNLLVTEKGKALKTYLVDSALLALMSAGNAVSRELLVDHRGTNNTQLIAYGGHETENNSSLVLLFDTMTNTWSRPIISGTPPIRRKKTQAVIDSGGKMYIFGGSIDRPTLKFYSDMLILDTVSWTWSVLVFNNSPSPRDSFTAVMLSSGVIVYIGGRLSDGNHVPMYQIHTFDTLTLSWNLMNATGTIPSSRCGASSVLTIDGRVFIFGGFVRSAEDLYEEAYPDLAVLDVTKSPYEWSIPRTTNSAPPSLSWHTSALVNEIMIIASGFIANNLKNSMTYMLDTRSHEWITSNPVHSLSYQMIKRDSSSNNTISSSIGGPEIVGITIGVIVFVILMALFALCFYFRYKKEKAADSSSSPSAPPATITNRGRNNNDQQRSKKSRRTRKKQLPPQKHMIQYQFVPDSLSSSSTPPNNNNHYQIPPQPQPSVMPTFQPSPIQQNSFPSQSQPSFQQPPVDIVLVDEHVPADDHVSVDERFPVDGLVLVKEELVSVDELVSA